MRHRVDMIISFGAAVLGSTAQTVVPLVTRQIVDNVILIPTSPLWPWLALLIGLGIATFAFSYLRRYRGGRVALAVQYDLRNDMHEHLQAMDAGNLDRMPTGQLVARANSDSALVQGLLSFLPIMSGNVLMMVLSIAVMLYLSPLLAVISLIMAPALLFVSYRMRWRIFPATWDAQQREGDVVQIVDEVVNGVRVVKAFGQEQHEIERIAGSSGKLYGSQLRATRLQARYQPLLQAIPSLGQVAVLAVGGYLVLQHDITLGTFLAFSTYVAQLMAPARQLAGLLTIGQQARAGLERIFQLLDLTPAIADISGALELPDVAGDIEFRDVGFSYTDMADGGANTVLDGVSLHIAAGERVALVGPSGSGKTTATLLVSRFYDPQSGTVLIDGHDIRGVGLNSLRRRISSVFEESFLFSDTVRANIAYGRPDATDEEIESAARICQAHDFILGLPKGYDTMVGERGLILSGGQRQRIAMARAIVADPRILILDDATSAVDVRTEEAIHDGLREIMRGRTTLLVAHRLSSLHLADRIIVFDSGRIVASGTHEHLLDSSAIYRALLTGFTGDDDDAPPPVGEGIEALTAYMARKAAQSGAGSGPGSASKTAPGTTAAAWGRPRESGLLSGAGSAIGAPSIGAGLGRGGGGGWRRNLAPTPELLARVAALRPVRDTAVVDLPRETRPDKDFSLWGLLREFRRPLLLGLLLVVLDAGASLVGPVLVRTGIDQGVSQGLESVLFAASGIYLVATLADFIINVGETFVTGRTAQRVMLSLRIRIWAQLQRLSLDYYEREMAGRIMTRMTTDVDQFESLIENGLLSALVAFVTFAGVGTALVIFNAELALCVFAVIIPLAIATVMFRHRAAKLYDQSRDRIAVVNGDFQESLAGVRESQAFVHEAATIERFHVFGTRYLDSRLAAQRLVATYFPFVAFLADGAAAIVLGVGAGMVAGGGLTTGALIAFLLYIDMFFSPIQQLSQVFDAWQQTRVSVLRIADLMKMDTLTPNAPSAKDPGRLRGELVLDGVHFSYPSEPIQRIGRPALRGPADARQLGPAYAGMSKPPEAIRGLELRIAPGETVALVGETGAGKSTVMKLLIRFYDPVAGSVRVDGRDLRELDLTGYRRQLGYVPQEAFLFTGSIRDNIAYGRPDAGDATVEAAARAVGAHDFIATLDGGYRHELAERGRSLSAGQRQLIALARAELVDPAILMLDEATSNLDLATEAKVTAAMHRLSQGRTTVVIAHRLQTAQAADRIVVLDNGRIVETGSHAELLRRGGAYAAMWEAFEPGGAAAS
ncbi:ABC transporter ATP-binding protein [Arthrobacter livingstonensis]|uniref:ABC transporter ATP-binding protein n=2 Tax=Arthrobacter livingstonensis TaxID=670078 RepID=A0A2V5LD48_9MICC|nr:ABC transporter ATP-binding protein [Arthrobacter livingstonensis]